MDQNEDQICDAKPERPRMRDWFWRPWYAKLWLSLILLFLLLGYFMPRGLLQSQEGTVTAAMALVLNPYLFFGCLGFGYFRAALKYRFGPMRPLTEDEWEWYRRHRGNDPTDPGNPDWHWHPMNPMSDSFRRRLYGDP